MNNILDYVKTNLKTFHEQPFNPVDSLVLCTVAYMNVEKVKHKIFLKDENFVFTTPPLTLKDLLKAELFPELISPIPNYESNKEFMIYTGINPRFRDIQISYVESNTDEDKEKQFAAFTFILPDKSTYIAFRGTDQTIVGWKEDFNMAFKDIVPSQIAAAEFINESVNIFTRTIRIGGHSKGGNLAMYGAMMCDESIKRKIKTVYSHDGPGFRDEILNTPEFKEMLPLVHKTIPKSSLVGMLLEKQENFNVVESNRLGGILQHDPYAWSVLEDDFEYTDRITFTADNLNKSINEWLEGISDEKRELFVDTMFDIAKVNNISTVGELAEMALKKPKIFIDTIKQIDPNVKDFVSETIKELVELYFKSLVNFRKKEGKEE